MERRSVGSGGEKTSLGGGYLHCAEDELPNFEMHQASSIVDTAGVFHGRDALRDALCELQEAFEELGFEAEKFIEAPDGELVVLIRARGRGRGSGMQIAVEDPRRES